jgi:hypothetical protein
VQLVRAAPDFGTHGTPRNETLRSGRGGAGHDGAWRDVAHRQPVVRLLARTERRACVLRSRHHSGPAITKLLRASPVYALDRSAHFTAIDAKNVFVVSSNEDVNVVRLDHTATFGTGALESVRGTFGDGYAAAVVLNSATAAAATVT